MTALHSAGFLPRLRSALVWRAACLRRVIGSQALLFYESTPGNTTDISRNPQITIRAVSAEALTYLQWVGNPYVWTEFRTWRGRGRQEYLVASFPDNSVVGICAIEWEVADITFIGALPGIPPDACYLSRVHVAPPMRGIGIGRELTVAASTHAFAGGAARMISACVPANLGMRALFASLGWSGSCLVRRWHLGPLSVYAHRPRITDRTTFTTKLTTL